MKPRPNAILNACVGMAIDATKPKVQPLPVGRTVTGLDGPIDFDPTPAPETIYAPPAPPAELPSAFAPVTYIPGQEEKP